MKLKSKLFFVLLISCSIIIPRVYAKDGPRIKVDESSWDFGSVRETTSVAREFAVENIGDETLIIKGIFTECECTKASISSEQIEPGEKAKLKVSYDAEEGYIGKDANDIYIISNDPQTPKAKITITVDVIGKNKSKLSEEEIFSKLKCCDCGMPLATCSCGHATEMRPFIRGLLDKGLSKENIFIEIANKYSLDAITDEGIQKNVEKRLIEKAGDTRPQIFIQPLSYDLGKIKKSGKEFILKVKIQNKGNKPLEINGIKASCSCVKAKLKVKNKESSFFGTAGSPSDWSMQIKPQETAQLIIALDLMHPSVHIGKLIRSVEVKSNDPIHSLIKVSLEADIVE